MPIPPLECVAAALAMGSSLGQHLRSEDLGQLKGSAAFPSHRGRHGRRRGPPSSVPGGEGLGRDGGRGTGKGRLSFCKARRQVWLEKSRLTRLFLNMETWHLLLISEKKKRTQKTQAVWLN